MSLNLTLLPFDCENPPFSHTVLPTYGGHDLHDAVKGLNQLPVPLEFTSYLSRQATDLVNTTATHYGRTTQTPYGEPVKYTIVAELLTLDGELRQGAAWAYIAALKPDTKVALFWH